MTLFWVGLAVLIAIVVATYVRNQRARSSADRRRGDDAGGSTAAGWSSDWGHGLGASTRDSDWGGTDTDGGGGGDGGSDGGGGGGGGGDGGGGGGDGGGGGGD